MQPIIFYLISTRITMFVNEGTITSNNRQTIVTITGYVLIEIENNGPFVFGFGAEMYM